MKNKIRQVILVPGFTCPSYSTVPRLVALLNDGRIFQMKVGEEAVWIDISIATAEPEVNWDGGSVDDYVAKAHKKPSKKAKVRVKSTKSGAV